MRKAPQTGQKNEESALDRAKEMRKAFWRGQKEEGSALDRKME